MSKYIYTCLVLLICSISHLVGAKNSDTLILDGNKMAHKPGDIIKIPAGKKSQLIIQNFTGSADKPITFINHGGLVEIDAELMRGGAINIKGCQHIRLTGTGDKNIKYGIKAGCGKQGPHAVNVINKSSSIEIDHIEIYKAGFAGFNVKDEPSLKNKTTRDHFIMRNISLHDNYVHHVQGEGFYVGHTFYHGYDPKKTGKPLYPHLIKGLRIYNNICESTGCEGIQVSSASDMEVYNNTIRNSGISPFAQWQDNGLQIGAGTHGKIYNNIVDTTPGNSFVLFGEGEIIIENNVFANAQKNASYLNAKFGKAYLFKNNTIINPASNGFLIGNWNNPPAKITVEKNLFYLPNTEGENIVNQNKNSKIKEKSNTKTKSQTTALSKLNQGFGAQFETNSDELYPQYAPRATTAPTPWLEPDH